MGLLDKPPFELVPLDLLPPRTWEGLPVCHPVSQLGLWPAAQLSWRDEEAAGVGPGEPWFDVGVVYAAAGGDVWFMTSGGSTLCYAPCWLWVPLMAAARADVLGAAVGSLWQEEFLASELREAIEHVEHVLHGTLPVLDVANFRKRVDEWVRRGRLEEAGVKKTKTKPGRSFRLVTEKE